MAAIDDLRLEVFRQCNECARSADTRKDAMLVLHAVITVSALLLSGTQGQPDLYAPALISLGLIGILVAILFAFFRGYHTGYLIQAEEIVALMTGKPVPP